MHFVWCRARLDNVQACLFSSQIDTVHGQSRRVADVSSSVRRDARILARVSRCHGLDAQRAHMLIDPRDCYVRIVETYRPTVKPPNDLYRKVAFHY